MSLNRLSFIAARITIQQYTQPAVDPRGSASTCDGTTLQRTHVGWFGSATLPALLEQIPTQHKDTSLFSYLRVKVWFKEERNAVPLASRLVHHPMHRRFEMIVGPVISVKKTRRSASERSCAAATDVALSNSKGHPPTVPHFKTTTVVVQQAWTLSTAQLWCCVHIAPAS